MALTKVRGDGAEGLTLSSTALTVANGLTLSDGDVTLANGHGVSFAATSDGGATTPSELFDDYEEGTFTPFFGGSSGDPSASYAIQKGKYTKVGDMVCATFVIITSGTPSGGGGSLLIAGMPFAFATTNTQASGCIGIVNNVTNNMSTSQLMLVGQSSGTNMNVMNCSGTSTTSSNNIGVSTVHNSGARIDGTIVYSITD